MRTVQYITGELEHPVKGEREWETEIFQRKIFCNLLQKKVLKEKKWYNDTIDSSDMRSGSNNGKGGGEGEMKEVKKKRSHVG